MYLDEVNAADPDYLEQQRETLCNWHYVDPVDESEWKRSQGIAKYQDGKANPFVLDCTLPLRTYCSDINLECTITSVRSPQNSMLESFQIQPNPFYQQFRFKYYLSEPVDAYLRIYNGTGQLLISTDLGRQNSGEQEVLSRPEWPLNSGPHFYQLILINRSGEELLKSGVIIKQEK